MEEEIRVRCEQLIENRDRVKSVFSWDGGLTHLACAGIYVDKGILVDIKELQISKDLIKNKAGIFSSFKSVARTPIAAMLAISGKPEKTLDDGLQVNELLKGAFWNSAYLPIAAMIIGQLAQPAQFDEIVARARAIYNRMKEEHPFLTSSEDSVLCSLMALSDKSNDILIRESEQCYGILKENFFSSNAVQSLSHVLALCEGTSEEKCRKTMELFHLLKSKGHKYGTDFELPTLGILALLTDNLSELADEMIEIDNWLSTQKGFGMFGNVTRKQRLMYAGILAKRNFVADTTMENVAVSGTISFIIAQQVAMCAAIAASTAATTAAVT